MKTKLTRQRLLELGCSLNGIIQELLEASEAPEQNPRKRQNKKDARVAKYINKLQSKIKSLKLQRP
jgi:DNA-binding transcriptional MerR regulator